MLNTNNKLLLTGNEAIAFGAYKAGVFVASGYPGTPSSEILPFLSRFKGPIVNWSINEKTALEIAIGASIGFRRSLFTTKHVGLNVAADPLMTLALTGVRGGIVIITADDPDMHSSQNEQDNRYYAKFANIPMLEPSDSMECFLFTKKAFEISEKFDTPVIVRTTTRISHSRSAVDSGINADAPLEEIFGEVKNNENYLIPPMQYVKNIEKFVMVPVYARKRHQIALERLKNLQEYSNVSDLNAIEYNNRDFGIITGSISYQYVKEAAPKLSVLKISLSYPLPEKLIREFIKNVKNIIVVEELEPFFQNEISSFGIHLKGKEFFKRFGELNPNSVAKGLMDAGFLNALTDSPICQEDINAVPDTKNIAKNILEKLPLRLPSLCSGCPHTSVFYALKRLKVPVMGDIGCYTLGALPPLSAMDSCISMGLAFGAAQGLYLSGSSSKKIVGVMGDSTFFHSGITSLIDAKYNNASITAIILDNSTTAMTGGQDHPGTGKNLSNNFINSTHEENSTIANKIDIKKVVEGIGIEEKDIFTIDTYDYNSTYETIKKAVDSKNLNVVITKRACVLYPKKLDFGLKFAILDTCNGCGLCMNIGCPSIILSEKITKKNKPVPFIDSSCIGCSICKDICVFGCISSEGGKNTDLKQTN